MDVGCLSSLSCLLLIYVQTWSILLLSHMLWHSIRLWNGSHCLAEVSHWMSANNLKLNSNKVNYFGWVRSIASDFMGSRSLSLPIDSVTVVASDHVRMLGVTFSSDLSLDKYVSSVCAACFFCLCQLWEYDSPWMLSPFESIKTRVSTFVMAWVDYCNMVLAGLPRSVTDKLQWALNAATCLITGIHQYDWTDTVSADLHWLEGADKVEYKIGMTIHWCLHNITATIPNRLLLCRSLRPRRSSANNTLSTTLPAGCTTLTNAVYFAIGHSYSPVLASGTRFHLSLGIQVVLMKPTNNTDLISFQTVLLCIVH